MFSNNSDSVINYITTSSPTLKQDFANIITNIAKKVESMDALR